MKKLLAFCWGVLVSCSLLLTGCESVVTQVQPTPENKPLSYAKVNRPQVTSPIHNIALLLPMSGEFALTSKAIHDGFLAAYYDVQQKKGDVSIKVVDTSNQDIVSVYNQTVAKGVDIVVGPLTKQEVGALAKLNPLPVPTLALNTIDNYYNNPTVNLYQFGLSPQDEAIQVAIKTMQDGHHNVAVIAPSSAWGKGIMQAFEKQLSLQGGKVIARMSYDVHDDFDLKIKDFLEVNSDDQLRKKSKQPIQHRQDIDAIFLISSPIAARQMAPLLKFYYEGKIALYALSGIYSGKPNPDLDRDIDGVIFCDMPWVINFASLSLELQDIHNKITALWSNSAVGGNMRLYALGIDAFNLAIDFNELLRSPKAGFGGATGALFLDDYNHIYRKLGWATMQEGAVVNY